MNEQNMNVQNMNVQNMNGQKVSKRERLALLALHETPGIGWQTLDRIVQLRFLEKVWEKEQPPQEARLRTDQRAALQRILPPAELKARLERYAQSGITVVTRLDEDYPERLLHMHEPPWVIYCKGNTALLGKPSLAMVGTRMPSAYGRQTAMQLATAISTAQAAVVSGMAKGIDRCAHEGALQEAGGTIGVLGTAIDGIYPAEHRALFHRVASEGLLVSEYPIGTASHPGLFPRRNRIIAGLTLGTIVVEAAARSGSLITAQLALEHNREVYAVPGPIISPKSTGTNMLIQCGAAKLLMAVEDIWADFAHRTDIVWGKAHAKRPPGTGAGDASAEEKTAGQRLLPEEVAVLHVLHDKPSTIEEIQTLTAIPFGHLHAVLINLTIKRLIAQHPGLIYSAL